MSRFVVSMTTSPRRIRLFRPVVEAVLRQSLAPDQFHLHLPRLFRGETEYEIPAWLQRDRRITIHRHDQDWGPIMKLLPTLNEEHEQDTIILTLDDDVVMPSGALERMHGASSATRAVCSRGFNFDRQTNHIQPVRGHLESCDALQGYSGCCYQRGQFDHHALLSQLESLPPVFRFSDDILLSNHIAGRGVRRATVEFAAGDLEFLPWSDTDPAALKFIDGSTHGRYQALREHLQSANDWFLH